ncbi:MAG: hypothetical protein U0893_09605 [Chloroflexota bacterium]
MQCAQCHARPAGDPFVCVSCGTRLYAFLGRPFDRGGTVGRIRAGAGTPGGWQSGRSAADGLTESAREATTRCPCCQYASAEAIRCPRCRSTFDRETFEELEHLAYVRAELPSWVAVGLVTPEVADRIMGDTVLSIQALRQRLGVPAEDEVILKLPAEDEVTLGLPAENGVTDSAPVLETVRASAAVPDSTPLVSPGDLPATEPEAPDAVSAEELAGVLPDAPVGVLAAASTVPAREPEPPVSRGLAARLLSERTLHTLLGLGAFLVLASGVVISTLNPTGLRPLLHALVVVLTTTLFYAAGLLVRDRLRLSLAGAALFAIGGVFAPLAVWTLGRQLLGWSPASTWLLTSLVCLPLYLLTHLRLRDRAAAAYLAVAGGSVVLALFRWLDVSAYWALDGLVALMVVYFGFAARLGIRAPDLRRALTWSANLVVPASLFLVILGPVAPYLEDGGVFAGWPSSPWGEDAGWWLTVLFYGLAAQLTGRTVYRAVAAWLTPLAYFVTLGALYFLTRGAMYVANDWYPPLLVALAVGFLLADRWRDSRPPDAAIGRIVFEPFLQVATLLLALAVIYPFIAIAYQIVTWLLVAVTLAAAARLIPHRAPAWASVAMLLAAWERALVLLQPAAPVWAAAWLLAAVVLLAVAEVWARRSGDAALRPEQLVAGVGCRSWFVGPLFAAGFGLLVFVLFTVASLAPMSPHLGVVPALGPVAIGTLLGMASVWAALAVTRRLPWLLTMTALLTIAALPPAVVEIVATLGRAAIPADFAIGVTALGIAYLLLSLVLERADVRRAAPFFVLGFVPLVEAQLLAARYQLLQVVVGGLGLLALAGTASLVHRGAHRTYAAVLRVMIPGGSPGPASALFFVLTAWLLPAWLLLLPGLVVPTANPSHLGVALTALAVVWVTVGRWGPFRRPAYQAALYVAGYVMSVMGPAVAAPEYLPRIATLAVVVLLYTGSAIEGRDSRWLTPVAVLLPVLLWQALEPLPIFEWAYGLALVVLAAKYLVVGVVLHHGSLRALGRPVTGHVSAWAQPFFAVGAILACGGLFRLAFQTRDLMALGYGLGCLYFVGSALVFRQPAFGALAVVTGIVTYLSALTLTPLPPGWYGVGLLPGSALTLALAETARRRLDRQLEEASAAQGLDWLLGRWALPLDAAAFGGTFAAPALPSAGMDAWSAAWWGGAAMLVTIAVLRRQPAWLYPAIGAALAGLATSSLAINPSLVASDLATVLIGPVWILVGLTWAFDRRRREGSSTVGQAVELALPSLAAPDQLLQGIMGALGWAAEDRAGKWLAPVRTWAWVTLLASTVVGATDPLDGLITAAAYGLLVAFVAQSRRGQLYAWGALVLAVAAFAHWLHLAGTPDVSQPVAWTTLALTLTFVSIAVRRLHLTVLRVWFSPVTFGSATLAVAAVGLALVTPGGVSLGVLAIATVGCGLSLFAHASFDRLRLLLYVGMLVVAAGYVLALLFWHVGQAQAFILPPGLTMLTIAYLEWRRHQGLLLKHLAEDAALALLLGGSLIQALGFLGGGFDRYTYDALLLLESSVVFGLGALLHWRRPFFAGALVLVADVGILLADPIRALNTWYLVAAIGLVMILGVILVEQRRQQIPLWLDEWRAWLERWD